MAEKNSGRLLWIDNIRLLMIVLVVMIHVNCTYSGFGMWYYRDSSGMEFIQSLLMGAFGSFTQAYFMGFLFFIAGFFIPAAYDRKGFAPFMKDRLIRLGVPALLYMLLIHPSMVAFLLGQYYGIWRPQEWIFKYYTSFSFVGSTGPLWFAVALLCFTFLYALVRRAGLLRAVSLPPALSHRHIIACIAAVSGVSFLVRIYQPIGSNILNMQLCYFTQYVVLFIAGILARRAGWIDSLSRRCALGWFTAALIGGTVLWLLLMVFGGPREGIMWVINGGGTWQSAVYAFWESFVCAGFCLGFLVLFRDFINTQNRGVRFLSSNAFGVYVLHAPVLVAVSLLAAGLPLLPIGKALIVAPAAVVLSCAVSALVRMVPGMKRII
jgi:surface polysaccharide O-acyltransferase-like enzyme